MNFYKNGNYIVCIMNDGTKIRKTNDDEFMPSFAENVDVKLTDKCGVGCPFCYEACTSSGKHGNIFSYDFINSLHPYTEMALNGNDLDHPELEKFLVFLKEKKVFANLTVHQYQFVKNYDKLKTWSGAKLIYGLGVSYHHYDSDFITKLQEFPNAVLHTINGIITLDDCERLKGNNLKMLILGYKNIRRGSNYLLSKNEEVITNQHNLYTHLEQIIGENWFKVVSFDNLAIDQLNVSRLMSEKEWNEFYMGDDGHYTFYIDLVSGKFAKNSLSTIRYDIGNKTIDEMFKIILANNND